MALLETPSRLWRRIEADEQNDMPSLPELPPFEDTNDLNATTTSEEQPEESHQSALSPASPLQSTPAPPSNQNTIRLQSSTSSTTRFAQSLASRASRSGSAFSSSTGSLPRHSRASVSIQRSEISFDDVSAIPLYPQSDIVASDDAGVEVGRGGLEDMSLAEVLQPPSRGGSPYSSEGMGGNGHSKYSYSVSLRSEPKVCTVLRLLRDRHEPYNYRPALSTKCEMCLFANPYLACVHPLSRGHFLPHRRPRIPLLILASLLVRSRWTVLRRSACSQSLLLQRAMMRAKTCR